MGMEASEETYGMKEGLRLFSRPILRMTPFGSREVDTIPNLASVSDSVLLGALPGWPQSLSLSPRAQL